MDPVGPWSAYASYNRLAGVQAAATGNELHHHLAAGTGAGPPPTTSAQLLPGGFLSPPPVGYETVFTPLFHHAASAKPTPHYVTQHRQVLAQAQAAAASVKPSDGEYHQAQAFFEQNPGAWQQNGPFGILPHESVVATTTGKNYENFNAHFAAQSINHLNSLAAKNATIRAQSPQVIAQIVTTVSKTQPNTTFFQVPATFSTTEPNSVSVNKGYATTNAQNIQQSCIVTSSNAAGNPSAKEYRVPQVPTRAPFLPSPNVVRMDKPFAPTGTKQVPAPQIQTKAQAKIYPEIGGPGERPRSNEGQAQQQNSPISFSIMDASRLNYANSVNNNGNNKRPFQPNYRHYQQGTNTESEFQRAKEFNNANGPDCSVVVPRRPSPLQAHSQASPIGHASSPVYPLYNSPMNSVISSPQNSSNHVTPPSPLDVSVPRPNAQNNVTYSSVITRALNPEKTFPERYERQNQNCWDERRKFNNNYNAGNSIEIPSRQIDVPNRSEAPQRQIGPIAINERQQTYYDSNHQVTLQDLSSCRGDPMSIVKNLQQQQSCQLPQTEIKQEIKTAVKRRKSSDKPITPVNDVSGRIPPPAHTTGANQQPQNGAYFDFDRWNLPAPPSKMFASQAIQQHQGLMVPHPHTHHPPPPIPYYTPFHLAPHPPEFSSVELPPIGAYGEHPPSTQPLQFPPPDDQPKVVVPNIEEELNFLTDATPPSVARPQQIQHSKAINPPSIAKPPDKPSGPGAGFMSSYIKFLQGERDSSPPPPSRGGRKQTWVRTKPANEIKPETNGVPHPVVVPPPPPPTRLSQGDPQDDPRYFPLPKERKQNSFDSSDDGISSDDDLFNKKMPPLGKDTVKEKNNARKGRPCKPGGPTERKRAKQQAKQKKEKDVERISASGEPDNPPRRETSKRAAKERVNIKSLITKVDEDIDEPNEFADSDSDPAWTPATKEEGDEDVPLKKGKRGRQGSTRKKGTRNLITAAAHGAGIHEHDSYASSDLIAAQMKKSRPSIKSQKQAKSVLTLEDNIAAAVVHENHTSNPNILNDDHGFKPGEFVVIKSELTQKWPAIWRVDGKTLLQKYEPFNQNGQTLYRNISTYTSWTLENKNQYLSVPVAYRFQSHVETIVEFLRNEMVIPNPEFVDKAMKESQKYQDNFEVYIQTLISQALDSNFLTEIFQEQDDYFLSNVKIIDEITCSKKQKIVTAFKWPISLQAAVSTWPCFNVIRGEFSNNDLVSKKCFGCGSLGITARVLMYGQPYNSTTLEGCQPDPRAVNEKDIIMCRICSSRVELMSKIAHQKYLMYIECAKRVAEKRTKDAHKDTTCILNELLADEKWLNQLFKDVRNSWAEADSIEHSLSHRQT